MNAAAIASLLRQRKETVAVSESSAGGLISAALLAIPGASAYFLGGGVIYTQAARRIREVLGATWGLSETGATGPTGNRYGDAAGHACMAVAGPVERVITLETGSDDREANMWAFTRAALELFEAALRAAPGG